MHRCLPACVLALLGVALLALSGCASSPPTRLYVVPSLTDTATAPPLAPHDLTLGVGPVTLPPYLDRPQIVTRAGRARLILAEFDQWAAPLQDTVARVLAENWDWAEDAARWTLEEGAGEAESPIGKYAACLALLIVGRDREARVYADDLRTHEGFPTDVADALAMLTAQDVVGYIEAVEDVLESFETRDEYLEDVPVADTVLVLQALAQRREMAAELSSPLLAD